MAFRNDDLLPSATLNDEAASVQHSLPAATSSLGNVHTKPGGIGTTTAVTTAVAATSRQQRQVGDVIQCLASINAHQSSQDIPQLSSLTPLAAQTITPESHPKAPLELRASMQPDAIQEPSDSSDDNSAYAETLEGGSGDAQGVPFYPGLSPTPVAAHWLWNTVKSFPVIEHSADNSERRRRPKRTSLPHRNLRAPPRLPQQPPRRDQAIDQIAPARGPGLLARQGRLHPTSPPHPRRTCQVLLPPRPPLRSHP